MALGILAEVSTYQPKTPSCFYPVDLLEKARLTVRLVFSVPCGAVIVALTLWKYPTKTGASAYSKSALAQVDLPGVILSLAGSIMLVFALEQGGVKYPWDSGIIVASFVVAGISWVLFGSWETFLTSSFVKMTMRPIFPTRLLTQRVVATALL